MTMIVTAPAKPTSEPPIAIGSFWPDIDPVEIREQQRIDNTIPPQRLRAALIEAAATAIEALAAWKIIQVEAGIASLDAIEAEQIDNTSLLVHRFRRAVGCLAKALIVERYRDFDTTGRGERNAEPLVDTIADCRRDYHHAIADIIGRPHSTIELI